MKSKSRIDNILSRVKKPSEAEAAALSKCFASNSSGPDSKSFDPLQVSTVKRNQEKKKRAIKNAKPSKVEVIMLREFQGDVPKGEARKKIRKKGRISEVQIMRTMSALQVENCIKRAFKHLSVASFVVLDADPTGHFLSQSVCQQIDGQKTISRRGALYLCEVN